MLLHRREDIIKINSGDVICEGRNSLRKDSVGIF
jgi:hypothetical protein